MNYRAAKLQLFPRNEGKIKSYESCFDIRAWNHDSRERDHYLREWMKSDMPCNVITVPALTNLLKTMTRKTWSKLAPRCHPDCKANVVLENICTSCSVIRDCLLTDNGAQKHYQEEEFETTHWPCDKCMEALKSIKLFWKVILDRVFGMNLAKNEFLDCSHGDNVRRIIKDWREEIVQQAIFVKKMRPATSSYMPTNHQHPAISSDPIDNVIYWKLANNNVSKSSKSKSTSTDYLPSYRICRVRKLYNRKIDNTVDATCQTCEKEKEPAPTIELLELQKENEHQKVEILKLTTENHTLKMELQQIYKTWSCKSGLYKNKCLNREKDVTPIPQPFETCIEESNASRSQSVKAMESEMIITLKNGNNENYRNISVLQVLHKSNGPVFKPDRRRGEVIYKKEDPIELLTKVQKTFGDMVMREIGIASGKSRSSSNIDVDAVYHKVISSSSAPSCTITSASDSDCIKITKQP